MSHYSLDHLLLLGEEHLRRVLREYMAYVNRARPRPGLEQAVAEPSPEDSRYRTGPIRAMPVPGGLHHTYRRAA
jgi:hypothetical protein